MDIGGGAPGRFMTLMASMLSAVTPRMNACRISCSRRSRASLSSARRACVGATIVLANNAIALHGSQTKV